MLAVIATVVLCCYFIPYFYIAAWLAEIFCVIKIIASDDNPEYKVPWLLFVLILPIAGFMLYFLFCSRKLDKKYIRRMSDQKSDFYTYDDSEAFALLENEDEIAARQVRMLTKIADAHLFDDGKEEYFSLGEDKH